MYHEMIITCEFIRSFRPFFYFISFYIFIYLFFFQNVVKEMKKKKFILSRSQLNLLSLHVCLSFEIIIKRLPTEVKLKLLKLPLTKYSAKAINCQRLFLIFLSLILFYCCCTFFSLNIYFFFSLSLSLPILYLIRKTLFISSLRS